MKICHVNLASGFSGGEQQTLQLIKQQVKLGYELTIVANPKSRFAKEVEQLGCTLILCKHFSQQHASSISKNCKLIHVHEGRAIYWALIQSTLFNIPYIVTRRIDNPLKDKFLSNLAYSRASALVGLSNEIIHQIKLRHKKAVTYKIPSSPVSYSIDKVRVDQIKSQFEGKFLVIQAANLLKHKGHDVTINAARDLEKTTPNVHFILLGDGKERETLETMAQGLNNITFMGRQSNMGDWFNAADLLIHPSYTEGLGSVILEAINAGLPIIASNAGGIPDIIDGKNSGLLIEPGSHKQLAEHISTLYKDKSALNGLISGGQSVLPTFNIETTAQQYQSLYNEVSK